MKKLLIVPAVIVAMLFGSVANATVEYTLAFSDVDQDTSYMTAIAWMQGNGVIQGYPDGTFQPDQCVNRAEFLKMMFLTLETEIIVEDGFAGSNYYDNFFSDTSTDQWYWPYVEQALRNKTVEGYPDGTFKPGQCVNRAEAVKMATLGFDIFNLEAANERLNREETIYSDAIPGENWFDSYLYSAVDRNAVGKDHVAYVEAEYYFAPGESMSRQEVAEMNYRMKTLTDNEVFGYVETMAPESLNYYISPSSGVSFLMPTDWAVTHDDYYTTAVGIVSDYPTMTLTGPFVEIGGAASINQRMTQCGTGEYDATCFNIAEGYTIGSYAPTAETLRMINLMLLTFKEPVSDGIIIDPTSYNNQEFSLAFDVPEGWSITSEEVGNLGPFSQLHLVLTHESDDALSMTVRTPPLETGYENSIITAGFTRPIDGLMANIEWLATEPDSTIMWAYNSYYVDELDWESNIEFFYSAPDNTMFDTYLTDYYSLLDSVEFTRF